MSTISDALRKVQKSRPDSTRGIAGAPPPDVPLRSEKASPSPSTTTSGSRLTVVIVGVLVLCLIIFLVIIKHPSPAPSRATEVKVDLRKPEIQAGQDEGGKSVSVTPVELVAEKTPLPPGPLPVLSGTFYSTQNPVAIINGSSLKEGETVGAYQVVKILPRSVILKSRSGEIELRLQ